MLDKKIKTSGDLKAANALRAQSQANQQRAFNEKLKQTEKRLNDMRRGQFKKIIIDSFLEVFASNYGSNFDYNSLIRAINFSEKKSKNGEIIFDYNFNENIIDFKSDAKRECRKFNENSFQDFITTENEISEDYLVEDYFDDYDEFLGFEIEQESQFAENIRQNNSTLLDGKFIPVSNNSERYGEFNRINKILGYAPTNDSAKEANFNIKKKLKRFYNT